MPINNISQVFTGTEQNTSISFAAKLQNGWQQKKVFEMVKLSRNKVCLLFDNIILGKWKQD